MTARPRVGSGPICMAAQHNTSAAYDWWGCRCPKAREEFRLRRKRRREGRLPERFVPALGTARRLQALCAIGYGWKELGAELGVSLQRAREWAVAPEGRVLPETAERVAAVFTRLAMVPGPSTIARSVARRNGWPPPLAWDDLDDPNAEPQRGDPDGVVDEQVVERALAGARVELTDDELACAVQMGAARGMSITSLALLFGLSGASAERMAAGELTPQRKKRQAVARELRRSPRASLSSVAKRCGVGWELVAAVRDELAARPQQIA